VRDQIELITRLERVCQSPKQTQARIEKPGPNCPGGYYLSAVARRSGRKQEERVKEKEKEKEKKEKAVENEKR